MTSTTATHDAAPDSSALRRRLKEAFEGEQGPFAMAVLRSVVHSLPAYVAFASAEGELLYMHHFAEGYGPADVAEASIYDFAAGVAHNFNNMLMAIVGNLSVLEATVGPSLRTHVTSA